MRPLLRLATTIILEWRGKKERGTLGLKMREGVRELSGVDEALIFDSFHPNPKNDVSNISNYLYFPFNKPSVDVFQFCVVAQYQHFQLIRLLRVRSAEVNTPQGYSPPITLVANKDSLMGFARVLLGACTKQQ